MAASRRVYLPGADFSHRPLAGSVVASGPWFRIHPSAKPAVYFSKRSEQRFTPENSPLGVLYAGLGLTTALFEVFGDEMFENDHRIRGFRWMNYSVSRLVVPRVQVCNLAKSRIGASLNVDLGTLIGQNLAATQAWALAIMEHPAEVHGIVYRSRFTGRDCLALFDRGGVPVEAELASPLHGLPEANRFLDQHHCSIV